MKALARHSWSLLLLLLNWAEMNTLAGPITSVSAASAPPPAGLAIGDPITNGETNKLLFVGSGNVLAQTAQAGYDATNNSLVVDQIGMTPFGGSANVPLVLVSSAANAACIRVRNTDISNSGIVSSRNFILNTNNGFETVVIKTQQDGGAAEFSRLELWNEQQNGAAGVELESSNVGGIFGGGGSVLIRRNDTNLIHFLNSTSVSALSYRVDNVLGIGKDGQATQKLTVRAQDDSVGFFSLVLQGLNEVSFSKWTALGHYQHFNSATIPVASVTDGFILYGDDQVAGNSCPHFRTENGDIIQLWRGAAIPDPAGGAIIDAEARAAITAILNHLRVTPGIGLIAD